MFPPVICTPAALKNFSVPIAGGFPMGWYGGGVAGTVDVVVEVVVVPPPPSAGGFGAQATTAIQAAASTVAANVVRRDLILLVLLVHSVLGSFSSGFVHAPCAGACRRAR